MDGSLIVTGGTTGVGGVIDYTLTTYPIYPIYYYVPQEPTFCMGKAHVFACDHEPKCLCGKIERANAASPR